MAHNDIPLTTALKLVALGSILTIGIPYIWHLLAV
jgi:hypothetical protein